MKKFVLAVLAYAVLTLAIAAPWHFMIFKDTYDSLGIYNRAEPIMAIGILTLFIQGAIMAFLYTRFYRGGTPIVQGVKFGLIMGLFLFSVSTLANAAKIEVSAISTWIAIQAAFHLIQFVVTGGAIGLIFGEADAQAQ